MKVGEFEVVVDRRDVRVSRDGRLVGTGRWIGCTISDRAGELDDDATWTAFAVALAENERQAIDQTATAPRRFLGGGGHRSGGLLQPGHVEGRRTASGGSRDRASRSAP